MIAEVQNISSINWNNYKITANDEVYQNISSALSDTGTLITTLIVVITRGKYGADYPDSRQCLSGSRKRETGILLAVGIAKPAVILQYVLETMLIAVVAFPLAYLSSKQVAGAIGTLFGKAAENVIVTPQHFTAGGSRRRYSADGSGDGVLYPGSAVETEADSYRKWSKGGSNMNLGIRAVLHTARKMEKDAAAYSACFCPSQLWCCPGLLLPMRKRNRPRKCVGTTGASFTVEQKLIHGWLGKRQWRFL
ncbi:MAG: hypothetical protein ACLVHV_08725 [Oscillospiraceae bacterium]